jgi:hypothetical protein
VVEEVHATLIAAQWADPLSDTADPLETIAAVVRRLMWPQRGHEPLADYNRHDDEPALRRRRG